MHGQVPCVVSEFKQQLHLSKTVVEFLNADFIAEYFKVALWPLRLT